MIKSGIAHNEAVARQFTEKWRAAHLDILAMMFKFDFLGEDISGNILPDPKPFNSKRFWEAAMANARVALRQMAQEAEDTTASSRGPNAHDCNSG